MPDSAGKQNFSVRAKFILALLSVAILPLAFSVLFVTAEYSSIMDIVFNTIGDHAVRQTIVEQEKTLFVNLSVLVAILLVLIVVMVAIFERFFI